MNQAKLFWTKKLDKFSETNPNEMELYDLSERKFRIIVIKILTEVKRIMHEQKELQQSDRKY